MRKIATLAGLVLAATSLSGCQAFGGGGNAALTAQDFDMSDYFERRIATGRAELKAGRPTLAIVAFRQASYDPRYAGEAYNGMAIGYTQIGREDLAASLFAKAVTAAPGDERFARNLARLEGNGVIPALLDAVPVELAVSDPILSTLAVPSAVTPEAAAPVTLGPVASGPVTPSAAAMKTVAMPAARTVSAGPRKRELTGAVRIDRAAATQLARASTGQVRIGTASAGTVHLAEKGHPVATITVEGRNSSIRVAQLARRGAQARKAYPIRIVLNSAAARAQRD